MPSRKLNLDGQAPSQPVKLCSCDLQMLTFFVQSWSKLENFDSGKAKSDIWYNLKRSE